MRGDAAREWFTSLWGALRPDPNVQGEDYPQTPPLQAFKSGSERSEAVLKEILLSFGGLLPRRSPQSSSANGFSFKSKCQ
jgi:hypothetical protein